MKNYTLLTRPEYFATLAAAIQAAGEGERVMVATMAFDATEPMVRNIAAEMAAAASRGAHVTLLIDAINFLLDGRGSPGPLLIRRSLSNLQGIYAETQQILESIRHAGGSYRITNIPKRRLQLPVAGRSHIKGAVVGDSVFVGGCNLERPQQLDIMMSWADRRAADTLMEWLERIAENGQTRDAFADVDIQTRINSTTGLLLDAGVPGQSLIYDEALRLIDDAREWIYLTCQYFPGGVTARHLAMAQARGVRVEIDYAHPRSHGSAAMLQRLHQVRQRARRLPRNFFAGQLGKHAPKLHAKILASEREALLGSHNYITQGVTFGTAELALHTTDRACINALRSFMKQQLDSIRRTAPAHPSSVSHRRR